MFRRFSDPVLLERCDVQRTADQRDLRAAERGERRARFARREQRGPQYIFTVFKIYPGMSTRIN